MKHLFFMFIIPLALIWRFDFDAGLCRHDGEGNPQTLNRKVRVQIQVVADTSNTLQADLEVPIGTSARDLMDRLFKMSYADFTHRFVNGIAGFTANPKEKKFWRLEIDGKISEIGIADLKIDRAMALRWVITEIK
ncbi:MAG: DUF4430 domain-containing protein [candidate division KSB1 bacterium]|nr:DUF4430 domain-containing protein [candidate division KSB1 bacterium]MDZ7304491.1 DUF4430 domain-containing protein [candidate division KSB1 bacterium]MDZ7312998.1 DUF4430 domain-containing protein [candidate division KSB1 bacterium]